MHGLTTKHLPVKMAHTKWLTCFRSHPARSEVHRFSEAHTILWLVSLVPSLLHFVHSERPADQLENSRLRRASASAPSDSPKSRNAMSKKPGINNKLMMIPHNHAATR